MTIIEALKNIFNFIEENKQGDVTIDTSYFFVRDYIEKQEKLKEHQRKRMEKVNQKYDSKKRSEAFKKRNNSVAK